MVTLDIAHRCEIMTLLHASVPIFPTFFQKLLPNRRKCHIFYTGLSVDGKKIHCSNGKYEYAFSVQNESEEKMMAHSRNVRSIPCTREKQCLIQCDSLLQEVIITPQLCLLPKVTHTPPSVPCVPGCANHFSTETQSLFPSLSIWAGPLL